MIDPLHPARSGPPRRLVLAAALVAGVVAASALGVAIERSDAQSPAAMLVPTALAQDAPRAESPKAEAPASPPEAAGKDRKVDAEITIDSRGVTVRKGERTADAPVVLGDHEFESFEQFVEQAPWLAGIVFFVTSLVFLVPLVVIVLVIWYKVRRARMLNETMLKLAERGAVTPAEAMGAIASGRADPELANVPSAAPLVEQARALRKRAAWSDLRKGVLIGGFGLGLTFYSMIESGTANGLGFVMLFVGIGYTILWYLEERPGQAARDRVPPPSGGA